MTPLPPPTPTALRTRDRFEDRSRKPHQGALRLALGLALALSSTSAFAQRMYASRGPRTITYHPGALGFYESVLDQFQKDAPAPWQPIETPWEIGAAAPEPEVTADQTDRAPVALMTLCLQVRPSFFRETLIKLREWSDGHADVEVVLPRHRAFWQQLQDPTIAHGTTGPEDLAGRLLWARTSWTDRELPDLRAWIKAFKALRSTWADPVPSTLACDGVAYRLSAQGGPGFGPGWTLAWTAHNPDPNTPAIAWVRRVNQGIQKAIDRDRRFQESLARLDDAGPGWPGYVALQVAMEQRNLAAVQTLLARGVDPNGPPKVQRVFSLPTSPEILDAVLKAGGRVDLQEAPSQETVLHVLLATDRTAAEAEGPALPLLERLLKAGADPNARDFDQRTPLHLASDRAWPGAIRRLLDQGAKPDTREVTGRTPLHELCASQIEGARPGEVESAVLLIDHGCPIDAKDAEGWTALAWAFRRDRPDLWTWLLAHGADPHVRGKDGSTLLHLLVRGRYDFLYDDRPEGKARLALFEKALDALLAKGLSLEARDHQGQTPLQVAEATGAKRLVRALVQRGAGPSAVGAGPGSKHAPRPAKAGSASRG